MNLSELQSNLADAFDELAKINDYLAQISPSLLALRGALGEVTPEQFEAAYQQHFLALTPPRASIETARAAERLRAIAETLRNS